MSDQSTRATEPNPDPRQPFTLSCLDAQALHDVAQGRDQDALNAMWLGLGARLGFVWTTVADLAINTDGQPGPLTSVTGATFTAWPGTIDWVPDQDAEAWLSSMIVVGDPAQLKNRELILRAWAAGRDTGFAMGSATAQANLPGLGWDGMELIRESAELLRSYQAHHEGEAERLHEEAATYDDPEQAAGRGQAETLARARMEKAERERALAEKLESFLADPTQSHLVHDGLREAREDNATAALAGWHAAMLQVRELIESGAWWRGETQPSGIPPLVLLDRLGELSPPEDQDEVFERLRNPMAQVERLRVALREWFDKSDWVRQAVNAGIPKKLGMPSQLGRHYADTARDMVARLNALLAGAIAGTLVGLRVQAASDVLKAMGFTAEAQPVPGVYSPDQGGARYPIAEGLECLGCTCPGDGGIQADCPTHGEA